MTGEEGPGAGGLAGGVVGLWGAPGVGCRLLEGIGGTPAPPPGGGFVLGGGGDTLAPGWAVACNRSE